MLVLTIWIITSLLALAGFIYINYTSGQDLKPDTLMVMILAAVIPLISVIVFFALLCSTEIIILKGKRK